MAIDQRYYEILRHASQDAYYQAINDPEDDLYGVLWDLFEAVVIEPGEIFDGDFREQNQFRYSINSSVTLEFFPCPAYFQERMEPDPYRDDADAAGVHLKFCILPYMSCLFSVGFQIWGHSERDALKQIWRQHRGLLQDVLQKSKPMIFTAAPLSGVDHASSLEELLDNYFASKDPENFIELQYPFAQFDETEAAQNFMTYMALLYHGVRDYCQDGEDRLKSDLERVRGFFSEHLPDLPFPLPCVELAASLDHE